MIKTRVCDYVCEYPLSILFFCVFLFQGSSSITHSYIPETPIFVPRPPKKQISKNQDIYEEECFSSSSHSPSPRSTSKKNKNSDNNNSNWYSTYKDKIQLSSLSSSLRSRLSFACKNTDIETLLRILSSTSTSHTTLANTDRNGSHCLYHTIWSHDLYSSSLLLSFSSSSSSFTHTKSHAAFLHHHNVKNNTPLTLCFLKKDIYMLQLLIFYGCICTENIWKVWKKTREKKKKKIEAWEDDPDEKEENNDKKNDDEKKGTAYTYVCS